MINNKMKYEIMARDVAIITLKGIISTRDAKIARLKARVAELEEPDMFWPAAYSDIPCSSVYDAIIEGATSGPLLFPVEIQMAVSLPNAWAVMVLNKDDDETTEHLFPTEEEAEAFCQKERAKQGEGA